MVVVHGTAPVVMYGRHQFSKWNDKDTLPTSGLLRNQMRSSTDEKEFRNSWSLYMWEDPLAVPMATWVKLQQLTLFPDHLDSPRCPETLPSCGTTKRIPPSFTHVPKYAFAWPIFISGDWHIWRIFLIRFREGHVEICKGRESLGSSLKIIGFSTLAVH